MDGDTTTMVWTLQQLLVAHYCKAAIITVFVVDYFHTLAEEINSVWIAPWTVVKIVFLISRYTPFIDGPAVLAVIGVSDVSIKVCTQLQGIQLWSCGIGQACSLILLFYRAYALVGRTRLSAILLSSLALVMTVMNFAFLPVIQRRIIVATSGVLGTLPKCDMANADVASNKLIAASIISIIVLETILFGVVYWAKVKKYREDQNWLVRKIYGDALMYYLFFFAISIVGVVVWFGTTGPIRVPSISMQRYAASILSSKIILSIRKYAKGHQVDEFGIIGTGETTQPVSGLRFASGGQGSGPIDTELRLY